MRNAEFAGARLRAGRNDGGTQLKARTKKFALEVMALVETLPRGRTPDILARQLLRSATSVSANYRAACRAKSTADFIAKMGTVEEEADESLLWMELLVEGHIVQAAQIADLMTEADELVAMTVASIKTARSQNVRR